MSILRVWWNPNFIKTNFEMTVTSITDAYIALEVLANLDLPNGHVGLGKPYDEFPQKHTFINIVERKYRAFRRLHGIDASWLITDNIGGLEVLENNEWVEWLDENYYDTLSETVNSLQMRGADIKMYLAEKDAEFIKLNQLQHSDSINL